MRKTRHRRQPAAKASPLPLPNVTTTAGSQQWSSSTDEPITFAGEGTATLDWSFDHAGDYVVTVTAAATYLEAAAESDGPETPAAPIALPAVQSRFHIKVADDTLAPELKIATTNSETPSQASVEESPVTVASEPGGDVTVLSDGDIRFASSLTDGVLDLRLLRVQSASEYEWFDPADTVISIPNSEPWPGSAFVEGNLIRAKWDQLVPGQGDLWRTRPVSRQLDVPVNPLTLEVDAGFVDYDAVAGRSTTFTMTGVQTESAGHFFTYHQATARTDNPNTMAPCSGGTASRSARRPRLRGRAASAARTMTLRRRWRFRRRNVLPARRSCPPGTSTTPRASWAVSSNR